MANKRTRHIKRDLAYGTMTIDEILEAAYIQGMSDMAIAVA